MSKTGKVIWAIEPFQKNPSFLKKQVAYLKRLSRKSPVAIEPVHVVNAADLSVTMEFSVPSSERVQVVATRACEAYLKSVKIPGLRPPKILFEPGVSLRKSAERLARCAVSEKAELVVIGTQAKRGVERWVLGSFAETFLKCAKTPVMVLNPRMTGVE